MPWFSSPVRSSVWARISTARWTSAFWSAIETCAANSWTSSNSSSRVAVLQAEPLERQDAGRALAAAQRDADQAAVDRAVAELVDPLVAPLVDDDDRLVVGDDPRREALLAGRPRLEVVVGVDASRG